MTPAIFPLAMIWQLQYNSSARADFVKHLFLSEIVMSDNYCGKDRTATFFSLSIIHQPEKLRFFNGLIMTVLF